MAAFQAKAPAAFLSYAHRDDRFGEITRLRDRLAHAVGVALGPDFEIFQDRDGIAWGQHWPGRLDEALEWAVFLIPILSPSYFASGPCRAELEKFLELERRTGRRDLILPIYFRTAHQLEDTSDPLAALLRERQYRDCRDLRHRPTEAPEVIQRLDQLADEIEAAIRRPAVPANEGGEPAPPEGRNIAEGPPAHPPAAQRPPDLEPIEEERRVVRNVALRAEPSLAAHVVTRLKAGALVYVAGRARDSGWLRIEEEDLRGYVVEDAVEPLSTTEAVPATTTVRPAPQPGEVFRDIEAPWCPELVVIPAGPFLMGSPEHEEGRDDAEGPQQKVMIAAPFALGRYTVTFEEYDAFCEATGREKPGDEGWSRGRRPVINVSWSDAQAYVTWLRKGTGKPYRLPSEAEWEYACRAGTTTRFFWGDDQDVGCRYGNGADLTAEAKHPGWTVMNCADGFVETAPLGSFEPNAFGLFDMSGNVWEWVEDRWHGSYKAAPADGSAWVNGTDSVRVVRGGSWRSVPWFLRSACRLRSEPGVRVNNLGFRVFRALTP